MIPIYGSMSRPGDPSEGLKAMIDGRLSWSEGKLKITVTTDEFTSICPTTGQPDFSSVLIEYVPNKFYLESKTIKFYLWSFREYGSHCEKLASKILQDVVKAIDPESIRVVIDQAPRGGIGIIAEAHYP
ncbi:MAG: preQ(1) synthase [Saprospiraceae bacterium]|nr:preQ(1) synthase [Saprospiraceae bacterium]